MKTVRIEIPLEPNISYLKIEGSETKPFEDIDFTKPIENLIKTITLSYSVPKELEFVAAIKVSFPNIAIINLGLSLVKLFKGMSSCPMLKITGLKKLTIFARDTKYEVAVNDEVIDISDWFDKCANNGIDLLIDNDVFIIFETVDGRTAGLLFW